MRLRSAASVRSWDALPAEALERVLTYLASNVLALCAAACVSRAWRDAAEYAQPQSAVRVNQLPSAVARRLTNAGLAALVRRSHGRLEHLNLCGAWLVTRTGLVTALRQPHALTSFRADINCHKLTAEAVSRALASRRGLIRDLRVCGLKTLAPWPDF